MHINLCRKWEEIGCATWSLPHSDKIVAKIYEMIDHNFAVGRAVSKRGQRLVDGKGVKRLVNEVF